MENGYMREYVVLAETCNFQETAEKMHVSQSSLSKHIKSMEEEIGVPLFDRTTRSVRLNNYGSAFLEYAKQIVRLCDECASAINEMRMGGDNKLSVGFLAMLGQYGIVEMLSAFTQTHPDISLNMVESNQPQELLRLKKCDFVFDAEFDRNDNDTKKLLYKVDHLVAVFPQNHPLAKEDYVTIEQLRDQPFIMHDSDQGTASMESLSFRKLCVSAGFEPNVVMTASYTSTVVKLVSQGIGIAVMNRMHTPADLSANISLVDIYPLVPFYIYLLYLKKHNDTPATVDFLHYIETQASQ